MLFVNEYRSVTASKMALPTRMHSMAERLLIKLPISSKQLIETWLCCLDVRWMHKSFSTMWHMIIDWGTARMSYTNSRPSWVLMWVERLSSQIRAESTMWYVFECVSATGAILIIWGKECDYNSFWHNTGCRWRPRSRRYPATFRCLYPPHRLLFAYLFERSFML